MKSKQGKASWKGIPASEREHVRQYLGIYYATGKKLTPAQAYQMILNGRKDKAQEEADKAKEEAAQKVREEKANRNYRRTRARKAIQPAILALASVLDVVESIEKGEAMAGTDEDTAMLARCAMREHCGRLERALMDLGFLKYTEPYFGE